MASLWVAGNLLLMASKSLSAASSIADFKDFILSSSCASIS
jgi:hypothetical protein